jgi:predicted RNA-binding Zn ribbon-like protein
MIANLTMGHAYECEKVEAAQTMIGKLTIVAARLKDAQQERLRVCDNPKCPFNEGMWGQ